jgi:hypothetical protein
MPSNRAPHALVMLTALALLSPAAAAEDEPKDRIELVCTEQPVRHVAFGDAGQVTYEELPPREPEPVRITVIRSDTSQRYVIDAARIESETPYLAVEQATWTHGQQVDADAGRLRLNLKTNVLSVAETGTAGQAAFRRFQCREPARAAD